MTIILVYIFFYNANNNQVNNTIYICEESEQEDISNNEQNDKQEGMNECKVDKDESEKDI